MYIYILSSIIMEKTDWENKNNQSLTFALWTWFFYPGNFVNIKSDSSVQDSIYSAEQYSRSCTRIFLSIDMEILCLQSVEGLLSITVSLWCTGMHQRIEDSLFCFLYSCYTWRISVSEALGRWGQHPQNSQVYSGHMQLAHLWSKKISHLNLGLMH